MAAYLDFAGDFDGFYRIIDELNAGLGYLRSFEDLGSEYPDQHKMVAEGLSEPL